MDEETAYKVDMLERHRARMRKASAKYYEKKRQAKIEAGTYKGRGRPRKVKTDEEVLEDKKQAILKAVAVAVDKLFG